MKLTDYLAIYAAFLSTAVFLWNICQSRPRVKVDLIFGIEGTGDDLKSGVYIFVRNISSHEVHLANIDILYRYMTPRLTQRIGHIWRFKAWPTKLGWVHSSLDYFAIESGCPINLEANKSHKIFIPELIAEKMLEKGIDRSLMAGVQDELWRNVYSKVFVYSLPSSNT